ncbi:MAG: DUF1837 domain-containing protein, partial [Proteobacteria bacterium]
TVMDLKTDSRMHYHGADGVYAGVTSEGTLKLYWGESKIYKTASKAIKECLSSLSPFLLEIDHEGAERERDLILLSDKADLSDPVWTDALKRYFDKNSPMSTRRQYCGVALVGFDAEFYPGDGVKGVAADISAAARLEMEKWKKRTGSCLEDQKLEQIEIELFCVPLPSAEGFRKVFLSAMGLKS